MKIPFISGLLLILVMMFSCKVPKPVGLGMKNKRLSSCPSSPNCVSTMEKKEDSHYLPPIQYDSSREEAKKLVVEIINSRKRFHLVKDSGDYLHFTDRIPVFGFVDDIELFFPEEEKIIHFRSASRVGHWDLGVNHSRMNKFRKRFRSLSSK